MGIALQSRTIYILAQIISILGMALNCFSFQQKRKSVLILMQAFGSILFSVHYFLLGAPLGFLMNIAGAVRGLVFALTHPGKRGNLLRIGLFLVLFLAAYPLAFTWLKAEPTARNLIVETLPVLAMCLATVSFGLSSAKGVRRVMLFVPPLWLTYNALNRSIGGVISESIGLCSIVLGIIRYDLGKKKEQPEPRP